MDLATECALTSLASARTAPITDIAVHQVRGPPAHWRAAHHASAPTADEQAGREQPGQPADRVQVEQVLQRRAVAPPPGAAHADDEPGRKEDDGRARQGVDPPRDRGQPRAATRETVRRA